MMKKHLLALLFVNGLAACSSPNYYTAPPELTPSTAATLVGSKTESPGALESDVRAWVAHIDGKYSNYSKYRYDHPQLVRAGTHKLYVVVGFAGRTGFATFEIAMAAGKTYVVRGSRDGAFNGALWIEDETGTSVSGKAPVSVSGPVNTMVPIFIPAK